MNGLLDFVNVVGFRGAGPGWAFGRFWAFDSRSDLFRSGLVPLALFNVFELILVSFEPFGGRNARDGFFGASLGLLGIGIGLFEVSNSSNLSAEGMKP